ncbi:MAG: hypothetical protein QOE33_3109 [Acidobacteriota bacterium]|nr:hypothetical protein [Acidobacteriota bacterium]
MRTLRAFACAFALVLLTCAAHAQDQTPRAAGDADAKPLVKLALEINFIDSQPPAHWQVGGDGWSGRFKRIEGWQPQAGSLPVQAVDVASRMEGDLVRINVSVHVGEKQLDRRLDVATFLAREGERISVWELRSFGVEPITIRVVNVRGVKVAAPTVTSRAPSLAVVSIQRAKGTFPKYEVSLRNDSGRDIVALMVAAYTTDRHRLTQMPHRDRDEPLVRAGDVYELSAWGGEDGRNDGESYTPGGLSEVIVEAAVFADGSYEGDAQRAAHVRALWIGRRLQIARLAMLLRDAGGSPDAGTRAGLIALRARINALDERFDPAALAGLLSQFPAFDAGATRDLNRSAEFELHFRKNELLLMLEKIDGMGKGGDALPGVRDWLLRTADTYETWLARLPAN